MITATISPQVSEVFSLEDWMQNPPEGKEWVDEKLVEKSGMNLKHSRLQSRLARYWGNYKDSSEQGGEVYTEVPCRTKKQGRYPDVAYLTAELLNQFGEPAVLPQSFPLIAEIVSPTDLAEEVIGKAQEYLQSGCLEVWLIFPENRWIMVITANQRLVFVSGEVVSTQIILQGFSVAVDELLG